MRANLVIPYKLIIPLDLLRHVALIGRCGSAAPAV
jgi:hypothetical protein